MAAVRAEAMRLAARPHSGLAISSQILRERTGDPVQMEAEMRKAVRSSLLVLVAVLLFLSGRSGWATPLQYHGGPFLESFEIYPLYYGKWTPDEIATHHKFLIDLAAYMSGQGAPKDQQPVLRQYGVNQVTVADAVTASPDAAGGVLEREQILEIIIGNQLTQNLPLFDAHTLIVVFPGDGYAIDPKDCGEPCGAYHASESTSEFWAVVPKAQNLDVIGHEIFEAAVDPATGHFQGWDESVDQCDDKSDIILSFGPIPPATDNTNGGACSATGYTSLAEQGYYGYKLSDFEDQYRDLFPQGWRLYILQAYVQSDGGVRYNAVLRPAGNTDEKHLYGVTFAEFKSLYNTLFPEGWRLYILQSYVADGDVRYNAVWRSGAGMAGEFQEYGVDISDLDTWYDGYKSDDWRLVVYESYLSNTGDVLYNGVIRAGDVSTTRVDGYTLPDFQAKAKELEAEGWRLYIVQPYVAADGTVLYNAIWHPGDHAETRIEGYTVTDFVNKYQDLWNDGWRLYSLNAYVPPGGDVRYDAVWRRGTIDRPL
jgi:hypothetical protein